MVRKIKLYPGNPRRRKPRKPIYRLKSTGPFTYTYRGYVIECKGRTWKAQIASGGPPVISRNTLRACRSAIDDIIERK